MAVIIRRLEESDETSNFDCGDAPLHNYLKKRAGANPEKSSIGVTYAAVEEAAPESGVFHDGDVKRLSRGIP